MVRGQPIIEEHIVGYVTEAGQVSKRFIVQHAVRTSLPRRTSTFIGPTERALTPRALPSCKPPLVRMASLGQASAPVPTSTERRCDGPTSHPSAVPGLSFGPDPCTFRLRSFFTVALHGLRCHLLRKGLRMRSPDHEWDIAAALLNRPAWHRRAACRGLGPGFFFAGQGSGVTEARAICRTCPVRSECLEAGLNQKFGVWGGTTERQRRRLRRERGKREEAA
jgi:WhiB family transcriptional regulator, redox-sensing transcriptional regulator